MHATTLPAVRRISRLLGPVVFVVAVAWPLFVLGWVMLAPIADLISHAGIRATETQAAGIALWQRAVCAAVGLAPALAYSAALLALYGCLRSFAAGDYFGQRSVQGLQGFAGRSFGAGAVSLIVQPICSVVLSWHFGPGHRQLAVGVSSEQIGMLLLAGVVWAIAGVMAEARRLADENAQFV